MATVIYPGRCTLTGKDRPEGCKSWTHVHWDRAGWCIPGHNTHYLCKMVYTTYGGRKTITCRCPCHTIVPGKGRLKLQEHIDEGY